jgi:hypothetical protein
MRTYSGSCCGVRAFGRYAAGGAARVIVNLRCVEGIDIEGIPIEKYDGRSY